MPASKGAPFEERVLAAIHAKPGCWNWMLSCDGKGYGQICHNYKKLRAHRVVYEMFIGPIPDGLTLDHLCRNTGCVNPNHLEPVTHKINMLRGEGFSGKNTRKTHCPRGHPYDGENTRVDANGWRECRKCGRKDPDGELWFSKTHCPHGHLMDEANTRISVHKDTGWRNRACRACDRERDRAKRAARRDARGGL